MRKPRNVLDLLTVLGLVAAGVVLTIQPSGATVSAGTYGTLTMGNATANGTKCASATISYASNGQLENWQIQLYSDAPNSTAGPHVVLTPAAPSKVLTFCTDHDPLGTYSFHGGVHGHLIGQNSNPMEPYSGTIKFAITKRAPSTLTVGVVRSHDKDRCPLGKTAHCSRVTGKLMSAGKPIKFYYVQIQAYRRHKWVRQGWTRTDGLGRPIWFVTITNSEKNWTWRLVFDGNDLSKRAVSRSFKMKY